MIRTTALRLAIFSAAALALAGCAAEKPKYAKEGLESAKSNMAMLKSGTDWQMAMQHYQAGDLDKALKAVDKSLGVNPGVAKSHVLRGRIMLEKGRLEDARLSLLKGEELEPTNIDAQYFLGILAERRGQTDEALTRYLKAADLDINNPQHVIAAAEMHIAAGRLDAAEQLLTERAHNFDTSAAVRQTLGHIAMLRNDPARASKHFNEALLLAPKDPRVLEDLASAQIAAGFFADAEYNLQVLLEDPSSQERRDLKQMRARCLVSINRPVEARTILQELTGDREGGRDVRSWTELGHVAVLLKDRITLRQAAARVMALAPEKPDGFELQAMSLRLQGKNDEALAAVDQAIARNNTNPTAYMLRALVLKDLGRTSESAAALATAEQFSRSGAPSVQTPQPRQMQSGTTIAQPDPGAQAEVPN